MGIVVTLDNDSLCTPEWILDLVREMGPITLDPCSNARSTVGASLSYALDRGEDGLALPWILDSAPVWPPIVWINPPYSKAMPWVVRACENGNTGAEYFLLLKHDPTTRYSAKLRRYASARCDFDNRIAFVGGAHKSGMMANCLWYLGERHHLFAHLFSPHGEVRLYADR